MIYCTKNHEKSIMLNPALFPSLNSFSVQQVSLCSKNEVFFKEVPSDSHYEKSCSNTEGQMTVAKHVASSSAQAKMTLESNIQQLQGLRLPMGTEQISIPIYASDYVISESCRLYSWQKLCHFGVRIRGETCEKSQNDLKLGWEWDRGVGHTRNHF